MTYAMLPAAPEILAHSITYSKLDATVAARVSALSRVLEATRGRVLFRVGDVCPGVFVVHAGLVRLSQTSTAGKVHVLRFVEAHHSFAEAAVLGPFNCPVQAEVVADAVLLLMPAEALREQLAVDHGLCLTMLGSAALRNRRVVEHAQDLALRDACGRLARYLCEHLNTSAGVHLRVPKQDLARHLNLTSETLSRILRRLFDERIIADVNGGLRVIDRVALEALAEGP